MIQATTRPRWLRLLLATTAAGLMTTATAHAQAATSTATPATAGGAATKVAWEVDGLADPVLGRIPRSLVMTAPGFRLDMRAVAKRCSKTRATLDECPKASKLGTGLMRILVHRPDGTDNTLPMEIALFQAKKKNIYAVTFLAGTRVVPGKLAQTADGVMLTFDPLPEVPEFPGVSYDFLGVRVDLGITHRIVIRRKGKRPRVVRRSLVHTPAGCATGTWASAVEMTFPDASELLLPSPITCRS